MLGKERMKWKRYRFTTEAEDPRPLVFNPKYPWWISGYAGDMSNTVIVAYLPSKEDLLKYWDDADDVDFTEEKKIEFSSRFPKPEYFKD